MISSTQLVFSALAGVTFASSPAAALSLELSGSKRPRGDINALESSNAKHPKIENIASLVAGDQICVVPPGQLDSVARSTGAWGSKWFVPSIARTWGGITLPARTRQGCKFLAEGDDGGLEALRLASRKALKSVKIGAAVFPVVQEESFTAGGVLVYVLKFTASKAAIVESYDRQSALGNRQAAIGKLGSLSQALRSSAAANYATWLSAGIDTGSAAERSSEGLASTKRVELRIDPASAGNKKLQRGTYVTSVMMPEQVRDAAMWFGTDAPTMGDATIQLRKVATAEGPQAHLRLQAEGWSE